MEPRLWSISQVMAMHPKTNPMRDLLQEHLGIDDLQGTTDDDIVVELRQDAKPPLRRNAIRAP